MQVAPSTQQDTISQNESITPLVNPFQMQNNQEACDPNEIGLRMSPSVAVEVPQEIQKESNQKTHTFDSKILHAFYNLNGDILYLITEKEGMVYEFPRMIKIKSRMGNFKKVRVFQMNAKQDLVLWIDDQSLNVDRIDNFFASQQQQLSPVFKSTFKVSSASFMWNDNILFSTIEQGIVEIMLLKLDLNILEHDKETPFIISDNKINLKCEFHKLKNCNIKGVKCEYNLSEYIQTTIHNHPMNKCTKDVGLWGCDGRNYFSGCLSGGKETEMYEYLRYECRTCDYDLCQHCIASTAEFVVPAIIQPAIPNKFLGLIKDIYSNLLQIVDISTMSVVSQLDLTYYSYHFDIKRITFQIPKEGLLRTYKIDMRGKFEQLSELKLGNNEKICVKGLNKKLITLYNAQNKTLAIHDKDNLDKNQAILNFKEHKEERKFVVNRKNYITIFYENSIVTEKTPFKLIYREFITQTGNLVVDITEKHIERYQAANLAFTNSQEIVDLNSGFKCDIGCSNGFTLQNVLDFPEINEFFLLIGNNPLKKMLISIKSKQNLVWPCYSLNYTFDKDYKDCEIKFQSDHHQKYSFLLLEKSVQSSNLFSIIITSDFTRKTFAIDVEKIMTFTTGYFDFRLSPNRQYAVMVNSTKVFDRVSIANRDFQTVSLLQDNQCIFNDHFEIIDDQKLLYKQDKCTLIKLNYNTVKTIGKIKPFGDNNFNFMIINQDYFVISCWDQRKHQIQLCSLENLERIKRIHFSFTQCLGLQTQNGNILIQNEQFQRIKIKVQSKGNHCYYGIGEYLSLLPTCFHIEYEDPKVIFYDFDKNPLAFIYSKFQQSQYDEIEALLKKTDQEIVKIFQKGIPEGILIHLHSKIGSFLHKISLRPLIIEEFSKQLNLIEKHQIPHLFFKNSDGFTPLNIAVANNQIKSIDMMIDMLCKFYEEPYFNYAVDEIFCDLIEKDINLTEYFQSKLPMFYIERKEFPQLHIDRSEILKGVNYYSLENIFENYQELFGNEVKPNIKKQNESNTQFPIEYLVVNMPETITKDPRKLMQQLNNIEKLDLFENQTIQTIITYKRTKYTKQFFQKQFYAFLLLTIIFLFDVYFTFLAKEKDLSVSTSGLSDPYIYNTLIMKLACLSILSYFAMYELQCAFKNWKVYLQDYWNIVDYSLIPLYVIVTVLMFCDAPVDVLQLFYCLLSLAIYIKICFFLRIYDGFSFLVSMIQGVFRDLKFFLVFYLLVLIFFTVLFYILTINFEDEYGKINAVAYFFMSFRTSVGDFSIDQFQYQDSNLLKVITWIVWVLAVLILNIVFMNFIIAVISESYEKIMQKLISQTYKVKIGMIVERELHLSQTDLDNPEYFPRYIILRRQSNNITSEVQEWEGFIKDLKNSIKTQIKKLHNRQQRSEDKMQKQHYEMKNLLQDEIKQTKNLMSEKINSVEDKITQLIAMLNKGNQEEKKQEGDDKKE